MASKTDKELAIAKLMVSRQKATSLLARLRLNNEDDAADDVGERIEALDKEIEKLLESLLDSWVSNVTPQLEQLGNANGKIQATIRGVMDRQKRAANIVKALGLLDEVIGIAKTFLV
jgi:hypothetical protein